MLEDRNVCSSKCTMICTDVSYSLQTSILSTLNYANTSCVCLDQSKLRNVSMQKGDHTLQLDGSRNCGFRSDLYLGKLLRSSLIWCCRQSIESASTRTTRITHSNVSLTVLLFLYSVHQKILGRAKESCIGKPLLTHLNTCSKLH